MSDLNACAGKQPAPSQPLASSADRLVVWEGDDAFFVGWEGSDGDWVARLEKQGDFPAAAWAERMAGLYNSGERHPVQPHGLLTNYAPG